MHYKTRVLSLFLKVRAFALGKKVAVRGPLVVSNSEKTRRRQATIEMLKTRKRAKIPQNFSKNSVYETGIL